MSDGVNPDAVAAAYARRHELLAEAAQAHSRISPATGLQGPGWDDDEAERELIEKYGPNWKEDHGIVVSDDDLFPGLEAGWMVCTLCDKQLAGHWTCISHFAGNKHRRNIDWKISQERLRHEIARRLAQPPLLALPAPQCASDQAPTFTVPSPAYSDYHPPPQPAFHPAATFTMQQAVPMQRPHPAHGWVSPEYQPCAAQMPAQAAATATAPPVYVPTPSHVPVDSVRGLDPRQATQPAWQPEFRPCAPPVSATVAPPVLDACARPPNQQVAQASSSSAWVPPPIPPILEEPGPKPVPIVRGTQDYLEPLAPGCVRLAQQRVYEVSTHPASSSSSKSPWASHNNPAAAGSRTPPQPSVSPWACYNKPAGASGDPASLSSPWACYNKPAGAGGCAPPQPFGRPLGEPFDDEPPPPSGPPPCSSCPPPKGLPLGPACGAPAPIRAVPKTPPGSPPRPPAPTQPATPSPAEPPAAGPSAVDSRSGFATTGQAPTMASAAAAAGRPPSGLFHNAGVARSTTESQHREEVRSLSVAPASSPPPSSATPGAGMPASTMKGQQRRVCCEYDAVELSEAGRPEAGYLRVAYGDDLLLLSDPETGHAGNQADSYVFARRLGGDEDMGWVPTCYLEPLSPTSTSLSSASPCLVFGSAAAPRPVVSQGVQS